jgi:hypothetical protein
MGDISAYDPATQQQIARAYLNNTATKRAGGSSPIDMHRAIAHLATVPSVVEHLVQQYKIGQQPNAQEAQGSAIDDYISTLVDAPAPISVQSLPDMTPKTQVAASKPNMQQKKPQGESWSPQDDASIGAPAAAAPAQGPAQGPALV